MWCVTYNTSVELTGNGRNLYDCWMKGTRSVMTIIVGVAHFDSFLDLIFGQTWYFTRYIFSVDGKSYSGCFESNINFSGNDVSSGTIRGISSAKACANECQGNEKWDIFTYDKERNECWLKISDAGRATANGRESGRKNSPQSSIYSGDFNLIQLQKVMKHWN